MARTKTPKGHTGTTEKGHTRDRHVDRIGRVTIYKRGQSYYLYYRERGKSVRRKVDGNLNAARGEASSANHALAEGRPSPFGFKRVAVRALVDEYVDSCDVNHSTFI